MPYRGCREGAWGKRLPQRHRIVGFAAVVEKGMEGRCRTGACREGAWGKRPPQRHRNVGFAAVVERGTEGRCRTGAVERVHGESGFRNGTESRVLLPLWKGEAEGRCRTGVCREGTWGKRLPQRHRIAGFAAVVERGMDNMAGRSRYK